MTGMGRNLSALAGLAAAAALWIAPQASATVTTSSITSPNDPTFSVFDYDSPNTIAVSGTTDGTTGDQVDLRCYLGSPPPASNLQATAAVQGDHTFSVPALDLEPISAEICRLRAVPSGTNPNSNLTPFAGPLMATGYRETQSVTGGPNAGKTADYTMWGQQLTAAADYHSYGSCGLCDGYLFDSNLSQSTTSFFANDWFNSVAGSGTRSAVQIGGVDAYAPDRAEIIDPDATGFPALSYGYNQNPANGNLTINESEPLVKCPDPTFPPDMTRCPSFVATGVRVDRTITQEQDGHLVFIKDRYVSIDGADHNLDLLPENEQYFGNSGPNIAYEFPGESSFSTHGLNDVVAFPDSTPGAIYLNVQGSTDGATDTGQGAIVFDRPSSPATFTNNPSAHSDFEFHQTALATPSCSPTLSFAYAQDYDSDDVQDLAQTALDRFSGSPATTCSPTPPASNPPSGPTGQRAGALKKCKKKHSKKARKKCRKRAKRLPV